SLAVQNDGTVLAWGEDSSGQLGNGATSCVVSTTICQWPIQVSGFGSGSGVEKVAAGNIHSVSLNSNGNVSAWAANTSGQLGRGTVDGTPFAIQNFADVIGIATGPGSSHTLALKSDGSGVTSNSVWSWGFNLSGQLGDGSTTSKNTPGAVTGLGPGSNIVAIA